MALARYIFTFRHPLHGPVEFRRVASNRDLALWDARCGYRLRFLAWPGDPIREEVKPF